MEDFFSALLRGIVGLFVSNIQHEQNLTDWSRQNQYNEMQYMQHGSPAARAKELGEAGLSDAAIGQALSGGSSSATMLASAPLQPNNISEALNSAFTNINATEKLPHEIRELEAEVDLKGAQANLTKAQTRVYRRMADSIVNEAQWKADKAYWESVEKFNDVNMQLLEEEKRKLENLSLEIDNYIKDGQSTWLIKQVELNVQKTAAEIGLTEEQTKLATANAAYFIGNCKVIEELSDVRKQQAATAQFYNKIIEKYGVPYEVIKDGAQAVGQVLQTALSVFNVGNMFRLPDASGIKLNPKTTNGQWFTPYE